MEAKKLFLLSLFVKYFGDSFKHAATRIQNMGYNIEFVMIPLTIMMLKKI